MSIKTRITIWYAIFLLATVAATLLFVLSATRAQSRTGAVSALTRIIADAGEELEYDDGQLEADDDLHFFKDGAYLSVYDEDGTLLMGLVPEGFDPGLPFLPGSARSEGGFYVLDAPLSIKRYGTVRLRAAASAGAEAAMGSAARLAIIALPALALIAALGGYFITRRAFLPVSKIADTAERIGGGEDLSARIGLPDAGDELSRLAAAFDRMIGRLEAAFIRQKQFTADASHELRTPTAVILSESEYALAHPDEAARSLSVIRAQAEKMTRLLSQLLALCRADGGGGETRFETLNLTELTEMVADEARERAAKRGMRLTLDLEKDILIRGDETMLMRMLINLLDNAVLYGREGGQITLTLKRSGTLIHGAVSDDGPGIAPEHLDKLFERFYQADPSRGGQGAGLGLSMVKAICAQHGGSVSAESRLGEGSVFRFTLPGLG